MNENYLNSFNKLSKYNEPTNYYRFYELLIDVDLIKENEKLENEIEKLDEKIERRKRRRIEREEIEENIKRKKREEKEKRRPVILKKCSLCYNTCLICGKRIVNYPRTKKEYYFKAHGSCIPNIDKCCICHKMKGNILCRNQCFSCYDNKESMEEKCFYCKEKLFLWDK